MSLRVSLGMMLFSRHGRQRRSRNRKVDANSVESQRDHAMRRGKEGVCNKVCGHRFRDTNLTNQVAVNNHI